MHCGQICVLLSAAVSALAADDAHWAFKPAVRSAVPVVTKAANPVDAFIRAKLAEKGLWPSPEADRRTLVRRLYFDLVGLPPRLEDVRRFEGDRDPLAYEKLVDRLLAS